MHLDAIAGGGNNLMDYAQLKLTPLGYTYNTYTGSKVASSSVGGDSLAFNSSEEVILSWSQGCGHCASLSANATVEEKVSNVFYTACEAVQWKAMNDAGNVAAPYCGRY